ncbi:MAG TPA: 4Fe-4S dicluster domain-containing protein [Sedimentisphaerales bacterium]|nr:4Fe-4S dicluster domain-containing protein [Sedimentisphaerales bacterium]
MKIVKLPKENLAEFICNLGAFGEIHAPIKRGDGSFVFAPIKEASEIELDCIRTILPLKKYFFRPMEVMFNFCSEEGYEIPSEVTDKRIVVFGAHPCEIHGLKILDMVFNGRYVDTYYLARRSKAAIIGLDCVPDDLCFCRSTGSDFVDTGFDLFLSDIDDSYLVRVGTSLGDDMVRAADSLFREVEKNDREAYKRKSVRRRESFKTEIQLQDLPEIMDLEYESQIWQDVGKECLSCGTCSMVCPTCYCYSVFDELNLDVNTGQRKRRWDSCLFKDYALVAGGHNFRAQRSSRVKNRYFHKQRGFVSQYGRPSCVGCGRCKAFCPAGVDIVEVVSKLRSETCV